MASHTASFKITSSQAVFVCAGLEDFTGTLVALTHYEDEKPCGCRTVVTTAMADNSKTRDVELCGTHKFVELLEESFA